VRFQLAEGYQGSYPFLYIFLYVRSHISSLYYILACSLQDLPPFPVRSHLYTVGLLLLLCIIKYFITMSLLKYNTICRRCHWCWSWCCRSQRCPLHCCYWSCCCCCRVCRRHRHCCAQVGDTAVAAAVVMSVVAITIIVLKLEMGEVQPLQPLLLPSPVSLPLSSSYRGGRTCSV
jgi:hypothetical protein